LTEEEAARWRRLSAPKPKGGIQNDVPRQLNAESEDSFETKGGSGDHSLPRAYDDRFIDMFLRSSSAHVRDAYTQDLFYKSSCFEALDLEYSATSALNRGASGKLKMLGLRGSMFPPPPDYLADIEDASRNVLPKPPYVPSLTVPQIGIGTMGLPNGALPKAQPPLNKEFSRRLCNQPNVELEPNPLIKVSDNHQKIIRNGIAQATEARGASGLISGIAIGSAGAVVSSVSGGALTVAPTATGVLVSLNLLNPWAWAAIGAVAVGCAVGAAIDYACGSSTGSESIAYVSPPNNVFYMSPDGVGHSHPSQQ
jgi:hypothetical protein